MTVLDFLKKWKYIGLIVVLIGLLLICRSCGESPEASTAEAAAREVWSPITAIGDFFGNYFDFTSKKKLNQEIDELREELSAVKTESSLSGDLAAENEELRELLELSESHSSEWECIAADVISRESDNWYEKLEINKGTADGIENNMAVVNYSGLIGKVVNATAHTAEVQLIIDSTCSFGGMLKESSIEGVITGVGGGKGLLKMEKLPYNADIQLNDIVVSSGTGGVFPSGLLVGTVAKVSTSSDGLSQVAVVQPYCDFDSILFVLVVAKKEVKTTSDSDLTVDDDSEGSEDSATAADPETTSGYGESEYEEVD